MVSGKKKSECKGKAINGPTSRLRNMHIWGETICWIKYTEKGDMVTFPESPLPKFDIPKELLDHKWHTLIIRVTGGFVKTFLIDGKDIIQNRRKGARHSYVDPSGGYASG